MEANQNFNQQNAPQKSTGDIISHAFETYKGIILYAIVAMVLYFVIAMIVQALSGFDSRTIIEEMQDSGGDYSSVRIFDIPGIRTYYGLSGLLGILMAPLYVGLIYIANKYNHQQQISFSDLFIGYKQNFVNIVIYALISTIIIAIAAVMCIIPMFFVIPFLMLGYPILLFENASFSEALSKSFAIAKENYGVFLGASLLGLLISISGVLLCGVGLLLTMYFYLIVMYSLYCAYLGKPRQIEFK